MSVPNNRGQRVEILVDLQAAAKNTRTLMLVGSNPRFASNGQPAHIAAPSFVVDVWNAVVTFVGVFDVTGLNTRPQAVPLVRPSVGSTSPVHAFGHKWW